MKNNLFIDLTIGIVILSSCGLPPMSEEQAASATAELWTATRTHTATARWK